MGAGGGGEPPEPPHFNHWIDVTMEEQGKPAHPTSVGNPVVARKPSLKRSGGSTTPL